MSNRPTADRAAGSDEIESCGEVLRRASKDLGDDQAKIAVLPLYASLPPTAQAKIFVPAPKGTRRVIIATNIAETSITIPGVSYVIDTGFKKEKEYIFRQSGGQPSPCPRARDSADPCSHRASQEEAYLQSSCMAENRPCRARSKLHSPDKIIDSSSFVQREGECFRLYTKSAFDSLIEFDAPEIQRCNLASAVLQLVAMGQDPFTFEYIDSPGREPSERDPPALWRSSSLTALSSRCFPDACGLVSAVFAH